MAYRDGSGAITIDEVAAASDIRRIQEAESYLVQSKSAITQLMDLADRMTGQANDAIRDKAYELQAQVNNLNNQLMQSRELINATVRRYQQIDAQLASHISKQALSSSVSGINSGHTGTNNYASEDSIVSILGGMLGNSGTGSSGGGGGRRF